PPTPASPPPSLHDALPIYTDAGAARTEGPRNRQGHAEPGRRPRRGRRARATLPRVPRRARRATALAATTGHFFGYIFPMNRLSPVDSCVFSFVPLPPWMRAAGNA